MELYEIMGEEFVTYIKGMYSIILIDKRNEFLFVTRDNYGIKPYIGLTKKTVYIFELLGGNTKEFLAIRKCISSWSNMDKWFLQKTH